LLSIVLHRSGRVCPHICHSRRVFMSSPSSAGADRALAHGTGRGTRLWMGIFYRLNRPILSLSRRPSACQLLHIPGTAAAPRREVVQKAGVLSAPHPCIQPVISPGASLLIMLRAGVFGCAGRLTARWLESGWSIAGCTLSGGGPQWQHMQTPRPPNARIRRAARGCRGPAGRSHPGRMHMSKGLSPARRVQGWTHMPAQTIAPSAWRERGLSANSAHGQPPSGSEPNWADARGRA
jgi:hypothetical protein